jgi:hypothetical protein
MRDALIGILIAIPALNLVVLAWAMAALRSFARRVPQIATRTQMDEFKAVVARQMLVARVVKPVLYVPTAVFLVGLVMGELGLFDLVYTIVPSLVVIVVAKLCGGIEGGVQSLPVRDEAMRAERDRVVNCWKTQPTPDW